MDAVEKRSRDPSAPPRGSETRAAIVAAALALFEEKGYEATTMRAVAQRAGVSLGNAYYYFTSKESLLQEYYVQSVERVVEASRAVLAKERGLKERLVGVLRAKIEAEEPYHRFAQLLFKAAADPQSPLNPFAPDSSAVRRDAIALFAEVLSGAKVRVPKDLGARLPELLWLYQMGIVLFWIHDASPGRQRTHALIEHGSDIVVKLISLAANPFLAPLRKRAVRLLEELRVENLGAVSEPR